MGGNQTAPSVGNSKCQWRARKINLTPTNIGAKVAILGYGCAKIATQVAESEMFGSNVDGGNIWQLILWLPRQRVVYLPGGYVCVNGRIFKKKHENHMQFWDILGMSRSLVDCFFFQYLIFCRFLQFVFIMPPNQQNFTGKTCAG